MFLDNIVYGTYKTKLIDVAVDSGCGQRHESGAVPDWCYDWSETNNMNMEINNSLVAGILSRIRIVAPIVGLMAALIAGVSSGAAQNAPSVGAGDADAVLGAFNKRALPGTSKGQYVLRLFAKGLDRPEAVVPVGDNAALVAERSGRILLLDGSGSSDLGTVSVPGMHVFYIANHPATEGLKDFIPVPGRPGAFLWSMTTGSAQAVRWTVGRARIKTGHGEPPTMRNEIIWQSEPQPWIRRSIPNFMGCRMAVDGGDVVVAMGANNRAGGSGRIMRVSLSGAHVPQLISTGHRNPSGVIFNSGILWEVEHGPKGGDELNVIVPGGDYGWPDVSRGTPDDEYHQSFLKSRLGSIDPVLTWTPTIAPSSITCWRGKFYVGGLKAEAIIELTVNGKEVVSQRRILELGDRIRDVRAGIDDHLLWVLTDGADAELYQVTPGQAKLD